MATSTVLVDKSVNGIFRRHLFTGHGNGTGKGRQSTKRCTGILQQRASLNNEPFLSIPTFLQEMLHFLI